MPRYDRDDAESDDDGTDTAPMATTMQEDTSVDSVQKQVEAALADSQNQEAAINHLIDGFVNDVAAAELAEIASSTVRDAKAAKAHTLCTAKITEEVFQGSMWDAWQSDVQSAAWIDDLIHEQCHEECHTIAAKCVTKRDLYQQEQAFRLKRVFRLWSALYTHEKDAREGKRFPLFPADAPTVAAMPPKQQRHQTHRPTPTIATTATQRLVDLHKNADRCHHTRRSFSIIFVAAHTDSIRTRQETANTYAAQGGFAVHVSQGHGHVAVPPHFVGSTAVALSVHTIPEDDGTAVSANTLVLSYALPVYVASDQLANLEHQIGSEVQRLFPRLPMDSYRVQYDASADSKVCGLCALCALCALCGCVVCRW